MTGSIMPGQARMSMSLGQARSITIHTEVNTDATGGVHLSVIGRWRGDGVGGLCTKKPTFPQILVQDGINASWRNPTIATNKRKQRIMLTNPFQRHFPSTTNRNMLHIQALHTKAMPIYGDSNGHLAKH